MKDVRMRTDNNESSYQDRQSNINKGELIFEKYMANNGYSYKKLGFDEKTNNIEGYWNVHPILRNLPDYTWYDKKNKRIFYFQVKGTYSVKIDDLINWNIFESLFCNAKAELRIAFCFEKGIQFYSLQEVKKEITNLTIKEWHDGKQYVTIPGLKKYREV